MNTKQVKLLRSQVRDIVQELLPQIVKTELYASLSKEIQGQLHMINDEVLKSLRVMDDRSKAVQDYIVKQVELAQVTPVQPDPNALTE